MRRIIELLKTFEALLALVILLGGSWVMSWLWNHAASMTVHQAILAGIFSILAVLLLCALLFFLVAWGWHGIRLIRGARRVRHRVNGVAVEAPMQGARIARNASTICIDVTFWALGIDVAIVGWQLSIEAQGAPYDAALRSRDGHLKGDNVDILPHWLTTKEVATSAPENGWLCFASSAPKEALLKPETILRLTNEDAFGQKYTYTIKIGDL